MPDSPHLPPHPGGVVLDAPSDYQEYDELRGLMAEDRRRRATPCVTVRVDDWLGSHLLTDLAELTYQLALAKVRYQLLNAQSQATRIRMDARHPMTCQARWYRRSMARIAHQYDATARNARRELVALKRPGRRPVIKKGLSR